MHKNDKLRTGAHVQLRALPPGLSSSGSGFIFSGFSGKRRCYHARTSINPNKRSGAVRHSIPNEKNCRDWPHWAVGTIAA